MSSNAMHEDLNVAQKVLAELHTKKMLGMECAYLSYFANDLAKHWQTRFMYKNDKKVTTFADLQAAQEKIELVHALKIYLLAQRQSHFYGYERSAITFPWLNPNFSEPVVETHNIILP